jgi:RNA polymerase sigma factor (sigma-70 family)
VASIGATASGNGVVGERFTVAQANRQTPVVASDLRRVDDAELVRRFAAHRDRGERDAARAVWEQLVIANHDRVRTLVVAWRHPDNAAVRIGPADVDDAVQLALMKFALRMVDTFRGVSEGELRAALRRLVDFACRQTARSRLRHDRRLAGHLDEPLGDEGEGRRFDAELARMAQAEAERESARRDARDWVREALERVTNPTRRAVLELTLEGVEGEEIARRLGVSRDVVYQHRTRGLRELRGHEGDRP